MTSPMTGADVVGGAVAFVNPGVVRLTAVVVVVVVVVVDVVVGIAVCKFMRKRTNFKYF